MTWKLQLLIDEQYNERTANGEQYNTKRRHGSRNCSSMSSIRKELLIVSSIILMSWHGSRNWDFDLIQLEGEQYVLAGVCWRLQKWILKVGLQSRKTINKIRTEHAFTGVNSKSAWRAARLQSSCTGVHTSRTRQRSPMALTMNYADHRSDGD
jgi:hypothetical protein